jgi:HD-GYP domain-containing protein (c-di-GMP phosphodiesterase class II)
MNTLIVDPRQELSPAGRFRFIEMEDKYRSQVLAMACTLVSLVDLRDSYTGGHSTRVADHSRRIGIQLGLDEKTLESVVLSASLHDVGKIGVPDHILLKPGRLTEDEFEYVKKHCEFGWMVLRNLEGFENAGLTLLHHHERMDGNGYPGQLVGDQIPLGARIIAVADTYDALTSNRPYRNAKSSDEAMHEIRRCSGTQFDPEIVAAFEAAQVSPSI